MKKFLMAMPALMLAIYGLIVSGCDANDDDINDNDPNTVSQSYGTLQTVKTPGIKSLYISNMSFLDASQAGENGAALPSIDIHTLSYIDSNGKNTPLIFKTSNEKEVVLYITRVYQVGDKNIIADYSEIIEVDIANNSVVSYSMFYHPSVTSPTGRTLINMQTGAMHDLPLLFNMYDYKIDDGINIIDGDFLYIDRYGDVYKIDLNNPSVEISYKDRQAPVSFKRKIGNKIIASAYLPPDNLFAYYSFDINSVLAPKEITPFRLTEEDCSFSLSDPLLNALYDSLFTITGCVQQGHLYVNDKNGDTWFYIFKDSGSNVSNEAKDYFKCKLAIDNDGIIRISESSEGDLPFQSQSVADLYELKNNNFWERRNTYPYDAYLQTQINDIIMIQKHGYCKIQIQDHGIQISPTATPATISGASFNNSFIKGNGTNNYIYWLDNTTIKRQLIAANSAAETIFTSSSIVNPMEMEDARIIPLKCSGDRIIFYMTSSASTTSTYSLSISDINPNPELNSPSLIASNSADIENTIELNF